MGFFFGRVAVIALVGLGATNFPLSGVAMNAKYIAGRVVSFELGLLQVHYITLRQIIDVEVLDVGQTIAKDEIVEFIPGLEITLGNGDSVAFL